MSSTFKELYSDFIDSTKSYTEKLDVTEMSFMRRISKAINQFQRDTLYCESAMVLPIDPVRQVFVIPNDCMQIIEIHDSLGRILLLQKFVQFTRNVEFNVRDKRETPVDYGERLAHEPRMVTLFDRELSIYPYMNDQQLIFRYYPNFEPISSNSPQWSAWFPQDINFANMFASTRVHPTLSPYENAFTAHAIADYIMSKGHINYKAYDAQYQAERERAIIMKPTYFRQAVLDYNMAPWS